MGEVSVLGKIFILFALGGDRSPGDPKIVSM